jgi:thiol:disulfide interchange protein DsbD
MKRPLSRAASSSFALALLAFSLLASAVPARAQLGGGAAPPAAEKLVKIVVAPVSVPAGGRADAVLDLTIEPGWHINANPPSPDYMIATQAAIAAANNLAGGDAIYPAPHRLKVAFDEMPLAVYDAKARIRVPLTASAMASPGARMLSGTLRFQACNDQVCLAPATVPFQVNVTVTAGGVPLERRAAVPESASAGTGAPAGSPSGSSASPEAASRDSAAALPLGSGLTGQPPSATRQAMLDNPLARRLESGSWTGFLVLFLIGLAMNLTPCVYPMLGVTVSIFGARRAAPLPQVIGYAVVYVLGIVLMYSALGVGAALTGGMMGSALQNVWVQLGVAAAIAALSLSMFGLYELQLPPALMQRLGGGTTTGVAGTFLSGLFVGIIAAPCIGPPVAALILLVGAKGDPWFGLSTFATLAIGLGAPYLVLGTFSNLLQRLPRSGEWMVWVKRGFGIGMLSLAAFYASLALVPAFVPWVAPVALLLGGLYLGFVDRSGNAKPGFRRVKVLTGFAGAAFGILGIVSMPRVGVTFEPYSVEAVASARQSGQTVMLDFTADWCAPCHELERFTFTDRRVREAAKRFRTLRVDLTRYDSPDAERWRREYGITGVPTVLFLAPAGHEVHPARVEGFLSPEHFLERMRMAEADAQSAGG